MSRSPRSTGEISFRHSKTTRSDLTCWINICKSKLPHSKLDSVHARQGNFRVLIIKETVGVTPSLAVFVKLNNRYIV